MWLLLALVVSAAEPVAVVNGVPISPEEFAVAAARKAPADGEALSPRERKDVLEGLVAEKLLYQEAKARRLDEDPKVQKVMVNTLLREDVYATVKNSDFSEEVLEAYFEANREEFVVPEKVQVKRILLKVDGVRSDAEARKAAEAARAEIVKGAEFKDVAARLSEDPYRRRGGDVGFVSAEGKPGLDQAIVQKAFSMQVDEVSAPFRTDEGWNILLVAARREAVERSYAQMKGSVLRKVKNERMRELYDGYVGRLRARAEVTVDERALLAVPVERRAVPHNPVDVPGGLDEDEGYEEESP